MSVCSKCEYYERLYVQFAKGLKVTPSCSAPDGCVAGEVLQVAVKGIIEALESHARPCPLGRRHHGKEA